jgi:hypothetical protein
MKRGKLKRKIGKLLRNLSKRTAIASLCLIVLFHPMSGYAEEQAKLPQANSDAARKELFDKMESITGIPWFYLAAIDQYERTLTKVDKKRIKRDGLIGIQFKPLNWTGILNPDHEDTNLKSIIFFNGLGKDGDGDGYADQNNDMDVLFSMASYILKYGSTVDDVGIALWEYYQNSRSVQRIHQFAQIYNTFDTVSLNGHAFPLPRGSDYSYRSTWGSGRSWGGYRIHEGTDIFASYGVPVRSTAYGFIEVMGWNPFGGWRIGIRDLNNVYHYYAHLSGFNKKLKANDVVKPGDIIGWVGSSGYGKPGTQGKFPSHLHYGMYRDNGYTEWSFDPYPSLRQWEREERNKKKKKTG